MDNQTNINIQKLKISKIKLIEFLLFVIFKILLFHFLVSYYNVYNYEFNSDIYKILTGWIVYLSILIIALKWIDDYYYSVLFKFLFLLGGVSTIVIYEIHEISASSFIKATLYWIFLTLAIIYHQNRQDKKTTSIQTTRIKNIEILLLFFSFVFTLIISGVYSGFRFTISFDEIYTYRLEMRAANMPAIIRYIFTFIGGAVLPYCFAHFLSRKSYIYVGITLISGILIFSINGMKTWLLIYLLIFLVFLSFKMTKKKIVIFILIAFSIWTLFSLYQYNQHEDITSLAFLGRTVYLPSKIGYNYISFFDQNELLYLRESILRWFFESPYPVNSAFYIVDGSLADINTSRANNGLWGDAYANFGIIGMFTYPFILVYFFSLLKNSMLGKDERVLISLAFIFSWTAVNTSLFTWLLTGGVILILIINKHSPSKVT